MSANLSSVRAVLFAKDLTAIVTFYCDVLGMTRSSGDDSHSILELRGFDLIVHRIPEHVAQGIEIGQPPVRRAGSAMRLDYVVENLEHSRKLAKSLGGEIDESPPPWADAETSLRLGCDPEGNVFGVRQHTILPSTR